VTDPLDQLAADLRRDGVPAFEWVVAHARDGTIRSLWDRCERASTLLKVYAYTDDRRGLVRAAVACARTALKTVPKGEPRPAHALKVADAWTRGAVTRERLNEAARAVASCAAAASAADEIDLHIVAYAVYLVATLPSDSIDDASEAADIVGDYVASVTRADDLQAEATHARLVRRTIPCPTLDQLMSRTL